MTSTFAPTSSAAATFSAKPPGHAGVLGHEDFSAGLAQQRRVHRLRKRALHGDDVRAREAECGALFEHRRGRQHAREQARSEVLHRRVRFQFFTACGEQNLARMRVQPVNCSGCVQHDFAVLIRQGRPQQPLVACARLRTGRPQIVGHSRRIRMCCVDEQRVRGQSFFHLPLIQAALVNRDSRHRLHYCCTILCCNENLRLHVVFRQKPAQIMSFCRTGENHQLHTPRYPLGVTMRPSITRVRLLPTNAVVSISTCVSRSSPSVVSVQLSPSRPMLRTRPQTVSGGTISSRISQARRRWSVRFLLDGLYSTMQKSPAAAPRRRCSILSHGVSRSDRLMHAKSHVSGRAEHGAARAGRRDARE